MASWTMLGRGAVAAGGLVGGVVLMALVYFLVNLSGIERPSGATDQGLQQQSCMVGMLHGAGDGIELF